MEELSATPCPICGEDVLPRELTDHVRDLHANLVHPACPSRHFVAPSGSLGLGKCVRQPERCRRVFLAGVGSGTPIGTLQSSPTTQRTAASFSSEPSTVPLGGTGTTSPETPEGDEGFPVAQDAVKPVHDPTATEATEGCGPLSIAQEFDLAEPLSLLKTLERVAATQEEFLNSEGDAHVLDMWNSTAVRVPGEDASSKGKRNLMHLLFA